MNEAEKLAKQKRIERKLGDCHKSWDSFKAANKEIAGWIEANDLPYSFAADMKEAVVKFGSLTPAQESAVMWHMKAFTLPVKYN